MVSQRRVPVPWAMSEWLDIMLGEIARKKEEEQAAREESMRRQQQSRPDETQEATTADSA